MKHFCCFVKIAGVYSSLLQPLNLIAGVGSAIEKRLQLRGVHNIGDLLLHLPKAYINDCEVIAVKALQEGVEARIQGRIIRKSARGFGRKRQVSITLADDDDARITLNFFHSGYMMTDARLSEGREISVRGLPERWGGRLQMSHPDWTLAEKFIPGWHPVYAALAGLSGKRIASMIQNALLLIPVGAGSSLDARLSDHPSFRQAIIELHQPGEAGIECDVFKQANRRVKLEELLIYLQLMQAKKSEAEVPAQSFTGELLENKLIHTFPFPLTEAQQQVWQEISTDLQSGKRMHRLLQGDVGAGKTWIAALAITKAAECGAQSALMAPTGILAEQHYQTLSELFEPLSISTALLTGSTKAAERKKILSRLTDGSLACLIGTHALISEDVHFASFGLALVDEQHRFGVNQRWALSEKSTGKGDKTGAVHLLGMTATPIPRSLALSLYGDLNLSIMRGMPPGRKSVETRVVVQQKMGELAKGMQRILDRGESERNFDGKSYHGGRIYWIVPRIDEEEDGLSVDQRREALAGRFPNENVLGLHGRMKAAEKQAVLKAFADGNCRILVSTTVIEVGVDVPEAQLIVIEQADQYGLAQLHQLRGRVGRSSEQGYAILIPGKDASTAAMERLNALVNSHDGLELAEIDLQLRGGGDAVGVRQSGDAGFRVLDLCADIQLIEQWYESFHDCEVSDDMVNFWRPSADSID